MRLTESTQHRIEADSYVCSGEDDQGIRLHSYPRYPTAGAALPAGEACGWPRRTADLSSCMVAGMHKWTYVSHHSTNGFRAPPREAKCEVSCMDPELRSSRLRFDCSSHLRRIIVLVLGVLVSGIDGA